MMNDDDDDPNVTVHDSIKPAGLFLCGVARFVRIQFGWWAVRANAASPIGQRLSASEAEYIPQPSFCAFLVIVLSD